MALYLEERYQNSMTESLIRVNLEAALIHIGIGEAGLFNLDYKLYGSLLPRIWIKSLWEFTQTNKISVPKSKVDLAQ